MISLIIVRETGLAPVKTFTFILSLEYSIVSLNFSMILILKSN